MLLFLIIFLIYTFSISRFCPQLSNSRPGTPPHPTQQYKHLKSSLHQKSYIIYLTGKSMLYMINKINKYMPLYIHMHGGTLTYLHCCTECLVCNLRLDLNSESDSIGFVYKHLLFLYCHAVCSTFTHHIHNPLALLVP